MGGSTFGRGARVARSNSTDCAAPSDAEEGGGSEERALLPTAQPRSDDARSAEYEPPAKGSALTMDRMDKYHAAKQAVEDSVAAPAAAPSTAAPPRAPPRPPMAGAAAPAASAPSAAPPVDAGMAHARRMRAERMAKQRKPSPPPQLQVPPP